MHMVCHLADLPLSLRDMDSWALNNNNHGALVAIHSVVVVVVGPLDPQARGLDMLIGMDMPLTLKTGTSISISSRE